LFRIILIAMLLPFSLQVFALGGWTGYQKITGIVIEGPEPGYALITLEGGVPAGNLPADTGCSSVYNSIALDSDRGRSILSVALAARLSDKPVRLALGTAVDGTCPIERPQINNIWL
jgi:hypothetical protein